MRPQFNFFSFIIVFSVFLFACGKSQQCVDFTKINEIGVCDNSYNPVCGCDDFEYRNECFAKINGVTSWIGGPCP